MLEKFLNGVLAVELDKNNFEQVMDFYNLIKYYIDSFPNIGWKTLEDYLTSEESGPCHFIDYSGLSTANNTERHINGVYKSHCQEYVKECVPAEIFIHSIGGSELQDGEYWSVLNGEYA